MFFFYKERQIRDQQFTINAIVAIVSDHNEHAMLFLSVIVAINILKKIPSYIYIRNRIIYVVDLGKIHLSRSYEFFDRYLESEFFCNKIVETRHGLLQFFFTRLNIIYCNTLILKL